MHNQNHSPCTPLNLREGTCIGASCDAQAKPLHSLQVRVSAHCHVCRLLNARLSRSTNTCLRAARLQCRCRQAQAHSFVWPAQSSVSRSHVQKRHVLKQTLETGSSGETTQRSVSRPKMWQGVPALLLTRTQHSIDIV